MAIERVSGSHPYVASWQAYGGHTMYVGVFPSTAGGLGAATCCAVAFIHQIRGPFQITARAKNYLNIKINAFKYH